MNEAKFTKGQWELDDEGYVVTDLGDDSCEIICDMMFEGDKSDSELANAALITTAPYLYKEIERDIHHLQVRIREAKSPLKEHLAIELVRKTMLLEEARGE